MPSLAHARTAADSAQANRGAAEVIGLLPVDHQEEYEAPIPEPGGQT